MNETFSVNLSLVEGNAVLADSQATGTIVDDEPRVRINGISKNEGNNVHDASSIVPEDDEHEQQPEGNGRHDEEVGGHDLARVIG